MSEKEVRDEPIKPEMKNQMQQILQNTDNNGNQNNISDDNKSDESRILDEMNQIIEKSQKNIFSVTNSNMNKEDIGSICAKLRADIETTKVIYQSKINAMKQGFLPEGTQSDLTLPDFTMTKRGTNWDQGNINTMNIWIKECNMQQFVYEFVLDKITKKSVLIKLLILIFCAIQTLVSCSNLGIDETEHKEVIAAIKICIPIISMITYILSHFVAISQFEDNIKAYTLYSNDIEIFLGNIISIASMKIELRPDGDEFILKNADIYAELNRRSPHIQQSMWQKGIKIYNQYMDSIENGNDNFHSRKKRVFNEYVRSDDGQEHMQAQEYNTYDNDYASVDHQDPEEIPLKPLNQRQLTQSEIVNVPKQQNAVTVHLDDLIKKVPPGTAVSNQNLQKRTNKKIKQSRPVSVEIVKY